MKMRVRIFSVAPQRQPLLSSEYFSSISPCGVVGGDLTLFSAACEGRRTFSPVVLVEGLTSKQTKQNPLCMGSQGKHLPFKVP
jgi:hypothetical protein